MTQTPTFDQAVAALPDNPTRQQVLDALRPFSVRDIATEALTQAENGGGGGGGGTGLPTGWTQDDSDPSNVQTNSAGDTSVGTLLVGSLDSANVEIWNEGLGGSLDDGTSAWLQMSHDGVFLRASAGATAINIDNSDAPAVAMEAGGLPIQGLADPTGDQDAATKAYVDAQAGGGGGGSLTLLSTLVLGSSAVIDVSGIDQSYEDLIIVARIILAGSADTDDLKFFFNGDTADGNYNSVQDWANGSSAMASDFSGASEIGRGTTANYSSIEITIPGYSTSGKWKHQAMSDWGLVNGSTRRIGQNFLQWTTMDAITRFQLTGLNYTPDTGSRVDVYGRGLAAGA